MATHKQIAIKAIAHGHRIRYGLWSITLHNNDQPNCIVQVSRSGDKVPHMYKRAKDEVEGTMLALEFIFKKEDDKNHKRSTGSGQ